MCFELLYFFNLTKKQNGILIVIYLQKIFKRTLKIKETMKVLKFLLIGSVIAVTMASCCNTNKKTEEHQDAMVGATEMAEPAMSDYYGTFEGTLPCADCEGIKTVVTLRNDSTYDSSEEYLGKEDTKFQASGVYNLLDGNIVELVTPSSNEKTYYKMQDGNLILVGEDLKVNEGELAEMYVLKKVVEEKQ